MYMDICTEPFEVPIHISLHDERDQSNVTAFTDFLLAIGIENFFWTSIKIKPPLKTKEYIFFVYIITRFPFVKWLPPSAGGSSCQH